MRVIDNVNNRLFKRESRASTVGSSNKKKYTYNSLFNRKDSYFVPYMTGRSILRDMQVATGAEILKYLLSSKKWILTAADEEDSEIYDFIKDMLTNMDTDVNTIVKQMTSAILWGFSVHEILYDVRDGKLVIKDMVPVHIKTLQKHPFTYDEKTGDLISIHQQWDNEDVEIPINKVLLYSYNSLYDEQEGHGLLYDFLPVVEDKENLMDWLMTFDEQHGSPTKYGKTSDPTSRDEMLNAFDDIADGTTGMTIGLEEEVGLLESSHDGEAFFKTLQYKDNSIFRRMFIGNLLMGDTSQTGTYAQSQTQLEFGSMVFDGLLEEAAKSFQKQAINPICEFNFGSDRKAPVISFDKFSAGDMQKLFTILQSLLDKGVIDSENSAIHEALALLFKVEAGVEYVNDEPEHIEEDFEMPPVEGDNSTSDILDELDVTGELDDYGVPG